MATVLNLTPPVKRLTSSLHKPHVQSQNSSTGKKIGVSIKHHSPRLKPWAINWY